MTPIRRCGQQLGFGDDEESQFEYWAAEENPQLDFSNCGVFGERTDEIAVRLADCAEGADVLIVQGGINDIAQGLAGGPEAGLAAAEDAAANIEDMIAAGQGAGSRRRRRERPAVEQRAPGRRRADQRS